MRTLLNIYLSLLIVIFIAGCNSGTGQSMESPPSIVLNILDDAGFADFQPFTETRYSTPIVQTLAEEGRRFNNFYFNKYQNFTSKAFIKLESIQ